MPKEKLINTFFDINKLPSEEGMFIFPISMSKIDNESQNAETYLKYIHHINPEKIDKTKSKSKAGAVFIYTDFLYLYSDEKACILKKKYMNLVNKHKNSFQNIIRGHESIIFDSFSYKTWNQFYLDNDRFVHYLNTVQHLYEKDELFQKYIQEDFDNLNNTNRIFDQNQIDFFLEEHMMSYLISKGQMKLENDFINGHEKWILIAYPGKPLKAHIYLHQLNPFKLNNNKNTYEDAWYDLEEKKLYDFNRIDLDTYRP